MNENDQNQAVLPTAPNPGPLPPPIPQPTVPKPRSLSWWLRKFFACNPFYLVSAALLLYGCYRVSMDTAIFQFETSRLEFNFSSVQIYEILLVVVGIFLARRSLWYDSTLLVGLENLLVFVPFILISQAALTGVTMTAVMCGAGVLLALLRFGSLRKYFASLNLPDRLLGAGFILLVLNVALPLIYRHFQEIKYGTDLEYGPPHDMNETVWLLMLPIALASVNFLPAPKSTGNLLPQHRWLPTGLFTLWIIVTGVHLYSLDYVYGYRIRPDLFAPVGWVLTWTIFLRCPANWPRLKMALTVPAVLIPLVATAPDATKTYLILTALNIIAYGLVRVLNRNNFLASHLMFASALLLIAGLPDNWLQMITSGLTQAQCVAGGFAAYLVFWTAWLRNAKLAVVGSIIFGSGIMGGFHEYAWAIHVALQGTFMFLLLHSLRWNDSEHPDANKVRLTIGLAWTVASFVWVNSDGKFWMPFIPGGVVLAIYCAAFPCRGIWRLSVVPASAILVMLSGPCSSVVNGIRTMPAGVLAVSASFLFLAFGTIAALTRHLWHRHPSQGDE